MYNIIHYLYSFSRPSETFIYTLIRLLEGLPEFKNTILTQKRELAQERPFDRVQVIFKKGLFSKLQRRFTNFSDIDWATTSNKPDVLHAHFGPNGVYLYNSIGTKLGVPIITSLHGTDVVSLPYSDYKYRESIVKMSKDSECYFTVPSKFLYNKLKDLGCSEENITVLNNTFDGEFLSTRKSNYRKPSDPLHIINVGRLLPIKGQEYLIRGFASFVRNVNPDSKLTIVGEGALKNKLQQLSNDLGVSKQVTFIDYVSHHDLPQLLSRHDLYFQPSIKDAESGQEESFGIAVLEAIMVGLPVVVTKTGGLPEVIGKETTFSYLIEPASEKVIYEKLKDLFYSNEAFADNTCYSEHVRYNYSQERYLKKIISVYLNAIR
ncbi:MAG: glycosyltransferase [Bacteroidota bacterium]